MNEEIKFRQYLWNDDSKQTGGRMLSWDEILDESEESLSSTFTCDFSNASELMQFTGLHDKNGKEIYEGDIVTRGDGNFVVRYKQDKYYVGYVATQDNEAQSYIHVWYDGIEVIGNVHQNPELL